MSLAFEFEHTPLQDVTSEREPIALWNPCDFDPTDFLTVSDRRLGDCARYILHLVHYRGIFDVRLRGTFVPLKAKYLRRFFPDNTSYTRVRDQLIESKVLLFDNHYEVGKKSKGFKLGPAFSAMRQRKVAIADPTLSRKILAKRRDWCHAPSDVHRHLLAYLRRIEIDFPAALAWLLGHSEFEPAHETSISMLHDRDLFFHVDSYGRVHTNLTNLKTELRGFLSYQGQPLVNLDIRNSQPLLFSILLQQHYRGTGGLPPDVARYIDLVQDGQFYNFLMDATGIPPEQRSDFKRKFFGNTFYCENWRRTDAARAFDARFPNVYRVVRALKEGDHTRLPKCLQGVESDLIIGGVARRCMEQLPNAFIGTIHDSILTTPDHAEAVQEIMTQEFSRLALAPTINIERLNRPAPRTLVRDLHRNGLPSVPAPGAGW
ncbi:hypothetical protein [Tautonia marina]|uniref:hypothetical protein n=1 Tax=Tautonia marina TaxID=2653855 RepID=UPI001260EBD1|nr:hypothetical protein [Tautonia marina]